MRQAFIIVLLATVGVPCTAQAQHQHDRYAPQDLLGYEAQQAAGGLSALAHIQAEATGQALAQALAAQQSHQLVTGAVYSHGGGTQTEAQREAQRLATLAKDRAESRAAREEEMLFQVRLDQRRREEQAKRAASTCQVGPGQDRRTGGPGLSFSGCTDAEALMVIDGLNAFKESEQFTTRLARERARERTAPRTVEARREDERKTKVRP